jgi:hypothetical protein
MACANGHLDIVRILLAANAVSAGLQAWLRQPRGVREARGG